MPPLPRGTCPVCGRDVALRKGLVLRQHDPKNAQLENLRNWSCRGSGRYPVEATNPAASRGRTHFVGDDCPGGHHDDPAFCNASRALRDGRPLTVDCPLCAYAAVHGWWGPGHRGTHCRTCHRSWTAKREAHCTLCHRHFGGVDGFDRHQVGGTDDTPLVCRDPATLTRQDGAPVLVADEKGIWRQPPPARELRGNQ